MLSEDDPGRALDWKEVRGPEEGNSARGLLLKSRHEMSASTVFLVGQVGGAGV